MKNYFTKEYIAENKVKLFKRGIVVLIALAAVFVFFFRTGDPDEIPVEKSKVTAEAHTEKEEKTIIVDVSGQVNTPQVIELKSGSRVSDAIDKAGGLTEKADISNINRAAEIKDGEKIYIPAKGENAEAAASGTASQAGSGTEAGTSAQAASGKVNINSASNSELQTLTGVGPATAEKILLYRSQNGGFKKLEDLKNVNGIGDKTFEKLKDHITI
ncbi:MAG: helix-hairpin-helix domain-containing protein [Eubacteriaceae bacterium]|nr:helix-hairpin-helix domain-containing protein [Eubacteriaceae bacterium]